MTNNPLVSVVIPARNAAPTITATLRGLAEQNDDHDLEVLVVDDGSTDATVDVVAASGMPARVVQGPGTGAGAARNAGAAAARGQVIAFTDADCVPQPDWLEQGLKAMCNGLDLVQGVVRADPAMTRGPFDRTVWVVAETGLYETANLFVKRDLFETLGGFQDFIEDGGRPLGEDVWFGWRARRSRARVGFSERAVVHHAVFARSPAGYMLERARLRHFPGLVRRVPELRDTLCWHRFFLSRRSAELDLLVVAAFLAAIGRSPPMLLGAVPYALSVVRAAARWGRHGPLVLVGELAADGLGSVSLLAGSVRYRTMLL